MRFDVIGVFGVESSLRCGIVAEEQTTCIYRNVEPLVWIERNRIRALQTSEQMLLSLVQNTRSAIRAVNVKPEIQLTCTLSDVSKLINPSTFAGTRPTHD